MKKGLDRYTNPKQIIKNRTAFIKRNYTTLSFRLNKKTDKKMIDYFIKADNKTQALRTLFSNKLSYQELFLIFTLLHYRRTTIIIETNKGNYKSKKYNKEINEIDALSKKISNLIELSERK